MAPPTAPATDDQNQLVTWLSTRHAPCPVCDYDLHALPEPKCPECGVPLTLEVRSPNQLPGPWIMALIGLSMAAGFDMVVVSVVTVAVFFQGLPPWKMIYMILGILILGLACIAGIWVHIRQRRRWMLVEPRTQWSRAWMIWGVVFVAHAGYAIYRAVVS
jgi:hypothetical protein